MNNTVIFVGSPENTGKGHTCPQVVKNVFLVSPYNIVIRIFASFVPPLSVRFRKIYVDFLGPSLALLLLSGILNYGHNYKSQAISFTPTECLLCYSFLMPSLCFVLLKLSRSSIKFSEIVSLLGYAMYGTIVTISVSLLFCDEESNAFFFVCLIVFGGLSTFRVAVVFLITIPKPAARLLVCSLVSVVQILLLTFVHFAYMHKSFVYGKQPAVH